MLSVVARDRAMEPRSSNATVIVRVIDENDNDPEIININSGVTTVEVPEVTCETQIPVVPILCNVLYCDCIE